MLAQKLRLPCKYYFQLFSTPFLTGVVVTPRFKFRPPFCPPGCFEVEQELCSFIQIVEIYNSSDEIVAIEMGEFSVYGRICSWRELPLT